MWRGIYWAKIPVLARTAGFCLTGYSTSRLVVQSVHRTHGILAPPSRLNLTEARTKKLFLVFASTGMRFGNRFVNPVSLAIIMSV